MRFRDSQKNARLFIYLVSFLIPIICYCAATLVLSRYFLRKDEKKTPPFPDSVLKEEME